MPRKKRAKKPAKKTKLESLSQTHGKEEKAFKATTLDQIWGDEGLGKYSTMDLKDYKTQIQEMGKTDLMAHASKLNLIPVDNRDLLEKRLISEFKRHGAQFTHPNQPDSEPTKVSDAVKKILSEGR